ncbi:MAG: sigma-54 dependent transcriptional regulator [Deltaproteobacteria bacterium]
MKEQIAVTVFAPRDFSLGKNLRNLGSSAAISFSLSSDIDGLVARADQNSIDAVLLYAQDSEAAVEQIRQLKSSFPHTPLVAWLVSADMHELGEVMQCGVADCLISPLVDHRLGLLLHKAVFENEEGVGVPSQGMIEKSRGLRAIVGSSKKIKEVFSLIAKICDTDTTVLIQGESGTGKELIAQALHYEGARKNGPFVPVNCGAIPTDLLESELFGHEKGAFTHALHTRIGRFELANNGTIFLDEVSEMSPMLQVKILRALQEKQFERIGGTRTITSDFRVIAATNQDLEVAVKEGRFREDLYYRLNVIPVTAPALRERPTDILPLAEYFFDRFDRRKQKRISSIAPDARKLLLDYSWPGNVRELENVVERLVILAAGPIIEVDDLPERIKNGKYQGFQGKVEEIPLEDFSLSDAVAAFEKRLIVQALNQTDWVKNRAAQLLNVNRTTLIEKMKRYDLVKPQVRLEGV